VRRSEFQRAVAGEFGTRAAALVADLSLPSLGGRTATEAMDAGVPPRDVWFALCEEMDVPESHRHGVGRLEPRR